MSMFTNPNYLNQARQFMAGPRRRPGSPNAGRFPDMMGFSKSPMGQGLMQRVLQQMRQRKAGIAGGRRRGTPEYGGPIGPYTPPTGQAPSGPRQVKRETTEFFDGREPTNPALSNVGRRP